MTKFEYDVQKYVAVQSPEHGTIAYSQELMEADLPQRGLMGWELVSVVCMLGDMLVAVFKKPIDPIEEAKRIGAEFQNKTYALPGAKPMIKRERKNQTVVKVDGPVEQTTTPVSQGCAHGGPLPAGARCSLCED